MITIMATTRIGGGRKPHLYIDEHMEAKGMSDEDVANRLDMNRTTIWKWREKRDKISLANLAKLAHALDLEDYRAFYRPPGQESVDEIIEEAPDNVREAVVELAKRLKMGGR